MTPMKPCYFDHYQSKDKAHEPFAIGGYNPLKAVYNYQPIPHDLPSDKNHYILGAQANVWTEYMTTPKHVEYMVYPRASALSEVLWTGDNRQDYNQFHKRLKRHLNRLAYWNVHYRPLDSLK
jgi:hexosaminidase